MAKIFLAFILCLFFSSPALSTTQVYYLRTTGSGSNLNSTGSWNVVPSSDANAMSASNFNDPRNWSETEDPNKISPGDIVYVKGSGWTSTRYNLTPVYGVTLDFYEDGNFNWETMSHTLEPVFSGSRIIVKVDGVTVQDGRFNYKWSGANRVIDAGITRRKISRLKVTRSVFNSIELSASVYLGFVCDSEISYNYFASKMRDSCVGAGRPISIFGGSRNKFIHNHIEGQGYTAIIFWHKRDWDDDGIVDVPSSGIYTADPDFSFENNEVAYNTIMDACEEGISYDVGSSGNYVTIVERDAVSNVAGNVVTLNNSGGEGPGGEWTGVGNLYSGYYMTAITNRDDTYGNHALITHQNNNVFTLAEPIANLAPGDTVVIGFAFRRNWIHKNTFGQMTRGLTSYILLEGMALENLVENNYIPAGNNWTPNGMKVSSLYQYNRATGNRTQTYASQPAAYNIVRNNHIERIDVLSWRKERGPGDAFITRNNTIINNTLHQDYYPSSRIIRLYKASGYLDGNVGYTRPYQLAGPATLQDTDPTAHVAEYFENWGNKTQPVAIDAPKGVSFFELR